MIVVNFFGPPGAGKSTSAASLFAHLKAKGYNVELVTEFAKGVVWEGHYGLLRDSLYILAHQNRCLERIKGKVDVVVTDCPLLITLAYLPPNYYTNFSLLVDEIWQSYDNLNIFLNRDVPFVEEGRIHDELNSNLISQRITTLVLPDLSFNSTEVDNSLIEERVLDRILANK